MNDHSKQILANLLNSVDEILLEYIERLEKLEGSSLNHGRAVALAVKTILSKLKE